MPVRALGSFTLDRLRDLAEIRDGERGGVLDLVVAEQIGGRR
jgi:hypothetical protein